LTEKSIHEILQDSEAWSSNLMTEAGRQPPYPLTEGSEQPPHPLLEYLKKGRMNKPRGYLRAEVKEKQNRRWVQEMSLGCVSSPFLETKFLHQIMMIIKALPWQTFIGYRTPSDHLYAWDCSKYIIQKTMREIKENYENTKQKSNEAVETITNNGRLFPCTGGDRNDNDSKIICV